MKGSVDYIETDVYSVELPDDVFEQIKADMAEQFTDDFKNGKHDYPLYQIYLYYCSIDWSKSTRAKNDIIRHCALCYALHYKDKYPTAIIEKVNHHKGYKSEVVKIK